MTSGTVHDGGCHWSSEKPMEDLRDRPSSVATPARSSPVISRNTST